VDEHDLLRGKDQALNQGWPLWLSTTSDEPRTERLWLRREIRETKENNVGCFDQSARSGMKNDWSWNVAPITPVEARLEK
jgi:hypothetical protein